MTKAKVPLTKTKVPLTKTKVPHQNITDELFVLRTNAAKDEGLDILPSHLVGLGVFDSVHLYLGLGPATAEANLR